MKSYMVFFLLFFAVKGQAAMSNYLFKNSSDGTTRCLATAADGSIFTTYCTVANRPQTTWRFVALSSSTFLLKNDHFNLCAGWKGNGALGTFACDVKDRTLEIFNTIPLNSTNLYRVVATSLCMTSVKGIIGTAACSNTNATEQWTLEKTWSGYSNYVPDGYSLVLNDEFEESKLDTTQWWTRYIYNNGTLDYLNDEKQRYHENNNHVMTGSELQLTARINSSGGYESGMIRSKEIFKYGYFEGRFKMPGGKGVWPAFWLNSDADANGVLSWPPEIDIFEFVVNLVSEFTDMIHTNVVNHGVQGKTVLYADPNFNQQWTYYKAPYNFPDDYHVIALLWDTDDTMATYIDGKMVYKYASKWVRNDGSDAPYAHILLNLAIGGSWAGSNGIDNTKFPQALKVDYVRVYQKTGARKSGSSSIGKDLCPATGGC